MNLSELILGASADTCDTRCALTDTDRSITYAELRDDVFRIAGALRHTGLAPGDVVGIRLPNGINFVRAFLGVLAAGGVATPIGMHACAQETSRQLIDANASRCIDSAEQIADLLAARVEPALSFHPCSEDTLACLPFSSGTTGEPKAVQLTHGNLCANVQQFAARAGVRADSTCLSMLPMSHIYGLTVLTMVPLFQRARVIGKPFDVDSFITDHERYRVTTTFIAPPMARLLAQHPLVERTDFSSGEVMISGAAALLPSVAKAAIARTGVPIVQGYGLTEASPVTHLSLPDTPLDSIGVPLPGTDQRIVDPDTLRDVPVGEIGELWVRGPQVMRGYLGGDDDSWGALAGAQRDWLRTGDMAYSSDKGEVFIVDRLKDIIKSHGFQVSPVKLEKLLSAHPAVADCAVVSGFGADGEEMPMACVVPHGEFDEQKLMEDVAAQVAPFERIRAVRVVDVIPRSAAGKTLRRELRDRV